MNKNPSINHFLKNTYNKSDNNLDNVFDTELDLLDNKKSHPINSGKIKKTQKSISKNNIKLKAKNKKILSENNIKVTKSTLNKNVKRIKVSSHGLFKQSKKMISNLWNRCLAWCKELSQPINVKTNVKPKQKKEKITVSHEKLKSSSKIKKKQENNR